MKKVEDVPFQVSQELEVQLKRIVQNKDSEGDLAALRKTLLIDPIEDGPIQLINGKLTDQKFLERIDILRKSYPSIVKIKDELQINDSLLPEIFQIYIPMAPMMVDKSIQVRKESGRAYVFGINGAQGSGKSTKNDFLQAIIRDGSCKRVAGFSLDDIYKTPEELQKMAQDIHPLFKTRGVAGTHDTRLGMRTINALMYSATGSRVRLPSYDKMGQNGGKGGRVPESKWKVVEREVDIVIFEGWMVGAMPQSDEALHGPINYTERDKDPQAIWRKKMNEYLGGEYQDLFSKLDDLFVIKVKSMDEVFKNRELQEQHLRRKIDEAVQKGEDLKGKGAMDPQEVRAFVELFQRTTEDMLEKLPDEARMTIFLKRGHEIDKIRAIGPQYQD